MRIHNSCGTLTRRGFLLTGTAAIAVAALSCTLTPEGEKGPYYVDYLKVRQTLTEGKPGLPLRLRIAVVDSKTCAPLPNVAVDISHCDASGLHSGFIANSPDGGGPAGRGRSGPPPDGRGPGFGPVPGFGPGPGGGPGGRGRGPQDETRFLRGIQLSDKTGMVEFTTIYPGWYSGRAIHIHMKVHTAGAIAGENFLGGHVSHTGQIYFPEDLTERLAKLEPYAHRLAIHRTTQEEDQIFRTQHGAEIMATMTRIEKKDEACFIAAVTLAVDPNGTPAPVGGMGRSGRGRQPQP